MLSNLKRQTVEFATRNLGYEPQIKELTDDIKKELPIVRDAQERLRLKRIKLKAEAMKYVLCVVCLLNPLFLDCI